MTTPQLQQIRVIILDDQKEIAELVEDILSQDNQFVYGGWASNHTQLQKLIENQKPHIALLDINLNYGQSGIDSLRWIKQQHPEIKTVMLTSRVDSTAECYQSGSDSYVLKSRWNDLLPVLRQVINGEKVVPNETAKLLVNHLVEAQEKQGRQFELSAYSERERELLKFHALGLERTQIVRKMNISPFTYKRHLQNIRNKSGLLELSDLVEHFKDIL